MTDLSLPQTEDLEAFVAIADTGSLNAAAEALGVSKSTVSRRLARIEDTLELRLCSRSQHRLVLTSVGAALLDEARLALDVLGGFREAARSSHSEPSGKLRVSAPRDLAAHPSIWLDFLERYPLVALELEFSNRYVEVVREGFDVVLRGGLGSDETLVAKRVGSYELAAVASPTYIEEWGCPTDSVNLRSHSCVLLSPFPALAGSATSPRPPRRHVVLTDVHMVLDAALAGHGIAILSPSLVSKPLADGTLVAVLDEYQPLTVPLYAMYPDRAYLRAAVGAFIDFVGERITTD